MFPSLAVFARVAFGDCPEPTKLPDTPIDRVLNGLLAALLGGKRLYAQPGLLSVGFAAAAVFLAGGVWLECFLNVLAFVSLFA